jgi:hypothetical protein
MYDANYLTAVRRARFWLFGPLPGWGIGLLFHALKIYWRLPPRWKQLLIDQELKGKN